MILKFKELTLPKLFLLVWRGAIGDDILNRAAELAFWFLMGFFPMLLFATNVVAMIGSGPGPQGGLMKYFGEVLPSGASDLVQQVLAQTTVSGKAWLSLGFALWAASSATTGLIDALNGIYEINETRPWWKSRLIAVALAIATGVALTTALIVVVNGTEILRQTLPGSAPRIFSRVAQWPAAALLLMLSLLGLYRFAPSTTEQRWRWLIPGSAIATAIWIAVSLLFKFYVRHLSDFGLLYGSLGTLVILMFWFYLSGIAILVGAEINVILEDLAAGQQVVGAKRRGQRSPTQYAPEKR